MTARRVGRYLTIALLMVLVSAIPSARAEGEALERIQPRVDRRSYQTLLDALDIDEAQRDVATVLYSDYAVALQALADQLDRAEQTAGGERLTDHLTGRAPLDAASLQRIQSQIKAARDSASAQAHQLVGELIENTHLLIDVPHDLFEAALRPLRRDVYLAPLRAGELDETYAGEGVDLAELASEASAAGEELEQVDPDSLQRVLDRYSLQMDELLRSIADSDELPGGAPGQIPLHQWRDIYELNQTTAQEISRLAAAAGGADAGQRWLDRFEQACFPWIFTNALPERQYDWIVRRGLDEQKQATAQEVITSYRRQRQQICRDLIDLLLEARLSNGVILHARMSPGESGGRGMERLYQAMMRNSGRRSGLDRETSDALKALLTDAQRKQMTSDIAAAAYGRRR